MRIDVEATKRAWRQTVWAAALAMVGCAALAIYFWTSATPDYSAIRTVLLVLVVAPLMLGICYLIKRFIEGLAN